MADYHAILKRAISSMPSPTGEARRAVYEKARTALVNQLKSFDPPLSASEITQQRLHLEDAIRKVESEVAKGLMRRPEPSEPTLPPLTAPPTAAAPVPQPPAPPVAPTPTPAPAPIPAASPEPLPAPVAEARHTATPHELLAADEPPPATFGRETSGRNPSRPKKTRRREPKEAVPGQKARLPVLVGLAVAVLVVAVGVIALWSQREALSALFGNNKAPVVDLAARSASEKLTPKATDRLGADDTAAKPQNGAAKPVPTQTITTTPQLQGTTPPDAGPKPNDPPQQQAVALVAQTAILYEEGKVGGQAQISRGKVVWQTQADPTDLRPGSLLLKARIEIPERGLVVLLQMHPNADSSFPASHMVEIKFNVPQGFEGKSITGVPGLILKADEQARGDALVGASAKVSDNFFWIALSATDADRTRNLKFFRERGWIDVPILYESGRRAILTLEKGGAGEKAVADAFASWGQG